MSRFSLFTLGAWLVKAFRGGCLLLLGAALVSLLANPEGAYTSRYLVVAGVCYLAAWVMGLVLKGHIAKRRSSRDGWRFWVCLADQWLEIDTESSTTSEVVLVGVPTDWVSYVNDFLEVLMYGLSRISWGTLILETRQCPPLFLARARKIKEGRVTTYTLGAAEEPSIEFVEAWGEDGSRIQLRVFEAQATSSVLGATTGERFTLRIEDVGELSVVYRPSTLRARIEALSKTETMHEDGPSSRGQPSTTS